jgi:ATP-dependent Clp protease ATP-binding subunit ClpB
VLFDEIEKAHPQVFDLFLQILDNALIRDKRGHEVSFRHALCIFTSNAGCDGGQSLLHASREEIRRRLGSLFREEFLDRIEAFVPFGPLSREARRAIASFQMKRMGALVRRAHGVSLAWDESVIDAAAVPPDGEPGGRHVLRHVQSHVMPAVVDALLSRPRGEWPEATIALRDDGAGGLSATLDVRLGAAVTSPVSTS